MLQHRFLPAQVGALVCRTEGFAATLGAAIGLREPGDGGYRAARGIRQRPSFWLLTTKGLVGAQRLCRVLEHVDGLADAASGALHHVLRPAVFALEFPKRPEHIGLRFRAANLAERWQAALGLIMVRRNGAGN